MTDGLMTRELAGTARLRSEGDGRTLDVRLLPWDTVTRTPEGPEMFVRGAFDGVDASLVTIEALAHGGRIVGRGTAIEDRDDAPYMEARISATPAGDELLELVRDGVVRQVSVAFTEVSGGSRKRPDGVTQRTRVDLRRVAILERGAYPGAEVLAIRREPEMAEDTGPVVEPVTQAGAAAFDVTPVVDRLERIEGRLGTIETMGHGGESGPMHYRAQSLGELLYSAWSEPELVRALSDQLSSENLGLIPKAALAEVVGIIARGRRTIDAFGVRALPASGMTVTWPKLSTPMTGLIAAQSAEKAAIVSAKVSFGEGSSAIVTYAGGSDVSYQLIRRSDPPYLAQYARVMLTAWANVTNAAFSAAVYAGGTGTEAWVATGDTDAAKFVTAVVNASLKVEIATGQPAEFVVLAPDLFGKVAAAFAPKSINPQSVAGTANAAQLVINVSGLPVINESALAVSTGYASNSLAASWLEDPVGAPNQISVDDVEKLGSNVAYWSLGAAPIFIPGGVVKFTIT